LLSCIRQIRWTIAENEWVLRELTSSLLSPEVVRNSEFTRVPEDDKREAAKKNKTATEILTQRFEVHLFSLLWRCQHQIDGNNNKRHVLSQSLPPNMITECIGSRSAILPKHPISTPSSSTPDKSYIEVAEEASIGLKIQPQYHESWYTHSPVCLLQDMNLISAAARCYMKQLSSKDVVGLKANNKRKFQDVSLSRASGADCSELNVTNDNECYVTTQVANYLRKVSDSISRCRSELARERLIALKESQERQKLGQEESSGASAAAAVISFSLPSNRTTMMYPELSDLVHQVNNSDPPSLLTPHTDASCDDSLE